MNSIRKGTFVASGEIVVDLLSKELCKSLDQSATFERCFGGSAANVAVNLTKLGVPAALISRVGNDCFGTYLIQSLRAYGVDTRFVTRDIFNPTSLSILSTGEPTAKFIHYRLADTQLLRGDIPDELLRTCKIFHATAHGVARQPSRDAILDAFSYVLKQGAITSFDPNYSTADWVDVDEAMLVIRQFVSQATFVKPSRDDSRRIFGAGVDDDRYIDLFHEMGAENVIFTKGEEGAILSLKNGARRAYPAAHVSTVVDATGAGDAFTAGFYAAYIKTGDLQLAMSVAAKVAAFQLGYFGAIAPLPHLSQFL